MKKLGLILYLIVLVFIFRYADAHSHSGSDTLIGFAGPFILVSAVYILVRDHV